MLDGAKKVDLDAESPAVATEVLREGVGDDFTPVDVVRDCVDRELLVELRLEIHSHLAGNGAIGPLSRLDSAAADPIERRHLRPSRRAAGAAVANPGEPPAMRKVREELTK